MKNIENFKKVIEAKKKIPEKKPRYGSRKLAIGLVSCMLGYTILVSPTSFAAGEEATTDVVVSESAATDSTDLQTSADAATS